MRGLVEVSGDFRGVEVTAYINHQSVVDGLFDASKVDVGTSLIYATHARHLNMSKFKMATGKADEESFLWVNVKSIIADVSSIKTNVNIKVTYSFTILDWLLFFGISAARKVRRYWSNINET